jgi:hypothetical protein
VNDRVPSFLTTALLAAAMLAILAIPRWSDEPTVTAKKTDEQISALQAETRRLATLSRDLEARVILLEDSRDGTARTLAAILPPEARWIPLRRGGSDQWDFPVGGRAQVQFLHLNKSGSPTFRIQHRAAEADVSLSAGQAHRAVDDMGETRRVYTTAVHQIRLDRTGRVEAALVSVTVTIE